MSESYEIKKAKIDSLVMGFTSDGYKSSNRIGQNELLEFLNKRSSNNQFDNDLSDKLFQVLSLDKTSTISVEDFINGFLQFEEDIRRNAEMFNMKLNQEEEIYANLSEQCRRYKTEKLNEEGLCENAKVYGEITDIDIKRKLEGIKEIILKMIYNEESEEMHFRIGDINSNEMLNKSFAFKPTSRRDHFEFIMKGVNDRNQIFDIGSKVFPLTEVNSHEEYIVQIEVPEIDNEEQVAAYIHAKIVLYWSDYKFYEKQRKKSESRLKKLVNAMNKAVDYLRKLREIYGDLTKKKSDLIVDFNNEKLMQRKGHKLNVDFNNTKEAEAPGGKYLVEFNNQREIQRRTGQFRVEYNNTKEVIQETKLKTINFGEESKKIQNLDVSPIQKDLNNPDTLSPQLDLNQQNELNEQNQVNQFELNPQNDLNAQMANDNGEQVHVSDVKVFTSIRKPIIQGEHINEPIFNNGDNQELINSLKNQQTSYDLNAFGQIDTNSGAITGEGAQFDINQFMQQNPSLDQNTNFEFNQNNYISTYNQNADINMNEQTGVNYGGFGTSETTGYGQSETAENINVFGQGGFEANDNNGIEGIDNFKDIVSETKFHTSINRAMMQEITNKPMFSENVLPVKVLPEKVNKVIVDSNISSLPVIYGGKKVTYENSNDINNFMNSLYQNNSSQGFYMEGNYQNNTY